MTSLFSSKRGVSPLIATILLVVVVVGIGAVIINIMRGYVTDNKSSMEERSEAIKCGRDIDLEFTVVLDARQVCIRGNNIEFMVDNTGGKDIDDLQMKVIGSTAIFANSSLMNTSDSITKGETQFFNISYSTVVQSDIQQVRIVPKIKVAGKASYNYCSDVALTGEDLDTCS